ncbi:hypothetical protein C8J57DRAFT_453984 [Mycena rebaudengoi]|nr:hypothetical protein C8J57DRAFT_453984 [Mycena rebaudengoi]
MPRSWCWSKLSTLSGWSGRRVSMLTNTPSLPFPPKSRRKYLSISSHLILSAHRPLDSPPRNFCPDLSGVARNRAQHAATLASYQMSPPTTSPTKALDLLRTWVLRSKDCPLSICLQSSTWLLNVDFIQALIPHSERWEYIDFNLPIGSLRLIGADFPLLRSLTLGPTHYAKEIDSLDAISLFSNAPLLTQVALYNTFGPSEIQLPWSQFTSISANFLTSTECTEILQHSAALR